MIECKFIGLTEERTKGQRKKKKRMEDEDTKLPPAEF